MKYSRIILLGAVFFLIYSEVIGQQNNDNNDNNTFEWLTTLNKKGIGVISDSLQISEEFVELLNDSAYRSTLFPKDYSWATFTVLIQQKQLKPAFWYLINLYPLNDKNKKLVLQSVLAYDQILQMDEVLLNTFYTYSFLDPSIAQIYEGVPEITYPDVLEEKLRTVKEITSYIVLYRNKNEE